jgi:uncharacterized protein YcfJ
MRKPPPSWYVEWLVPEAIRELYVALNLEPHRFNYRKTLMTSPKRMLILTLAMAATGAAFAEDVGRVLSSQPIVQQVAVPRKVCSNQQVEVQQQKSGAGAAMGAIAGGAIGNSIGRGSGNAAATVLGIFGGAILGDRIEGTPASRVENVQSCTTQNFYENQTVGYNVTYEFGGRHYSVQMPNDPGATIQLQVSPVGVQSQPSYQDNVAVATPEYPQQRTVIESRAIYQPYDEYRYYPSERFHHRHEWRGDEHRDDRRD